MGYTHYFPHTEVPEEIWEKIVEDCKKVLRNTSILIEAHPFLDDICFNGLGDDGHETFLLERKGSDGFGFQFCKTAQKPYDLLVCACLLIYKHHSPNTIELFSDGDEEDWKESTELVNLVFGY
ncbi:MAG: hypothetical protein P9L97_05780 [Candidatus Tenebribacter davisii]|nr:hypothetical protein [Candidatus Tenebribacter davisii]